MRLLTVLFVIGLASCDVIDTGSDPNSSNNDENADGLPIGDEIHEMGLAVARYETANHLLVTHYTEDFTADISDGVSDDLVGTGSDKRIEAFKASTELLTHSARAAESLGRFDNLPANDSGARTVRQPLVGWAIAGAVMMGIAGAKKVKTIFDVAARPVIERTKDATPQELERINVAIGLSADASKEDAVNHLENEMGFLERDRAVDAIIGEFNDTNDASIRPFGAEVNQAFAETAVKAGDAAISLTVSAATSATGGQGIGKTVELLSRNETWANAVELGVSVVSETTGTPINPLDVFATFVSTGKATTSGPYGDGDPNALTKEEAERILGVDIDTASVSEIEDALATLYVDILEETDGQFPWEIDDEGVLQIEGVPQRWQIHQADQLPDSYDHYEHFIYDMLFTMGDQAAFHEGVDVTRVSEVVFTISGDGSTENNTNENNANNVNNADGDRDSDGVPDSSDNCPDAANRHQIDSDNDGVGNECDETACPTDLAVTAENCGGPNTCYEGEICDRGVIACVQEQCPTNAMYTFTKVCCCDCWEDQTFETIFDPCRPGFVLFCAPRE